MSASREALFESLERLDEEINRIRRLGGDVTNLLEQRTVLLADISKANSLLNEGNIILKG